MIDPHKTAVAAALCRITEFAQTERGGYAQ
jgi:hypothetical protein